MLALSSTNLKGHLVIYATDLMVELLSTEDHKR